MGNGRMMKWYDAKKNPPPEFVSVLGYMPSMKPMPSVRECFLTDKGFYFPALCSIETVTHWAEMPAPPCEIADKRIPTCGECVHAKSCEQDESLTEFSRDSPAYCKAFKKKQTGCERIPLFG